MTMPLKGKESAFPALAVSSVSDMEIFHQPLLTYRGGPWDQSSALSSSPNSSGCFET